MISVWLWDSRGIDVNRRVLFNHLEEWDDQTIENYHSLHTWFE